MNIAVFSMGSENWYGGIMYLRNILYAVSYVYGESVKRYFVYKNNSQDFLRREFTQVTDDIIFTNEPDNGFFLRFIDKVTKNNHSHKAIVENLFVKKNIDIIFGNTGQLKYDNIPIIDVIMDFQHKHLPEMFSKTEYQQRENIFSQIAKTSSIVAVSSESVKRDFQEFLPQFSDKVRIIRPVSYIPEPAYSIDPKEITDKYKLPEKFIYVPNQFWKHKNHELIFKAVKLLKNKGVLINLVCSGSQKDHRHKNYFSDLHQWVSKWDTKGQIKILGVIPIEHVIAIMRQSICVFNASLFEGFGLSVSMAKALGKMVLLSDIAPHHEHAHPHAIFFPAYDIIELVEKMALVWHSTKPGTDIDVERKALAESNVQLKETADSFMSAANDILNK